MIALRTDYDSIQRLQTSVREITKTRTSDCTSGALDVPAMPQGLNQSAKWDRWASAASFLLMYVNIIH